MIIQINSSNAFKCVIYFGFAFVEPIVIHGPSMSIVALLAYPSDQISLRSSPMRQGSLGRMTLHTLQCRPDVQNMRAATRGLTSNWAHANIVAIYYIVEQILSPLHLLPRGHASRTTKFQGCVPATGMKIGAKRQDMSRFAPQAFCQ
jgi:hypothetical protein